MKRIFVLLILAAMMNGCQKNQAGQNVPQPPEKTWRDIVVSTGAILATEQRNHLDECKAQPSDTACVAINKAGAAHNLARVQLATYCQFAPNDPPDKTCVPVPSALAGLQSAIANLQDSIAQLQAIVGRKQ